MEYTFPFHASIDLKAFLADVKACENEIFFESTQKDRLALRSTLCQYILYSICNQPQLIKGAIVRCTGEHDRDILATYFSYL